MVVTFVWKLYLVVVVIYLFVDFVDFQFLDPHGVIFGPHGVFSETTLKHF